MGAGSHIVASRSLYGGSHNLLHYTLPRFGIETTLRRPARRGRLPPGRSARTRGCIFGETLGNPGLDVLDVPRVAEVAHEAGIPLLVDSTFTTPYLMRPFDLGADLVVPLRHQVPRRPWRRDRRRAGGRRPLRLGEVGQISDSDRALRRLPQHGVHRGVDHRAFILRARREGLRDFGACMSPHNAFQILQGIETLTPAHAAARGQHPQDRRIPEGQPGGGVGRLSRAAQPSRTTSWPSRLLPNGCGAVFSFGIKGGAAAGKRFIETLQVFSHLANVGDAKSLVIHPATTTHYRMDDAALARRGHHRRHGTPLGRTREP